MEIPAVALTLLAVLLCVMSAGIRVKAPLGGNASVRCSYPRGSERYPKYFSKTRPEERIKTVRVKKYITWSRDGRFSLMDDREKRVLTVTIRNLTVEDAGPYWCGVDKWGEDKLTEVNLDVIQNSEANSQSSSTQNASPCLTTSSPVKSWEPHQSLAQEQISQTVTPPDETLHLGASLTAVVLLCGIASVIFAMIKKNKTKRATASPQPRICTDSNKDTYVYEEIFPTSTSPPSDLVLHDPTTSRALYIHQHPSEPQSAHPVLSPPASSQDPHPESAVYSFVSLPKRPPDDATPFTSAESASLHSAQSSHVVSSGSAFSEKSCDLYATVKRPAKVHQCPPDGASELQ